VRERQEDHVVLGEGVHGGLEQLAVRQRREVRVDCREALASI
jgi:hypothetical protein